MNDREKVIEAMEDEYARASREPCATPSTCMAAALAAAEAAGMRFVGAMTASQISGPVEAGVAALWALDHEDPWPGADSFGAENLRHYMTASAAVLAAAAPEIHRLRSEAESVYLYLIHGVLRRLDTTGPKPAEDVMDLCEQIGALVLETAARAEALQAERDRLEQNFNALSTAALRWEPGRAGALLDRLRRGAEKETGDG